MKLIDKNYVILHFNVIYLRCEHYLYIFTAHHRIFQNVLKTHSNENQVFNINRAGLVDISEKLCILWYKHLFWHGCTLGSPFQKTMLAMRKIQNGGHL